MKKQFEKAREDGVQEKLRGVEFQTSRIKQGLG